MRWARELSSLRDCKPCFFVSSRPPFDHSSILPSYALRRRERVGEPVKLDAGLRGSAGSHVGRGTVAEGRLGMATLQGELFFVQRLALLSLSLMQEVPICLSPKAEISSDYSYTALTTAARGKGGAGPVHMCPRQPETSAVRYTVSP